MLSTLGAQERRRLRRRLGRPRAVQAAAPAPVPTARATVVRAEPFAEESRAARWLEGLRRDRAALTAEVEAGVGVLNAMLRAHRAAVADPYVREVHRDQALVRRAGYGEGALVADGRFGAAVELPATVVRRRRSERLAPQERLAAVLGGRQGLLAGEELVLRARLDLDSRRPREAALQSRVALEALLSELSSEPSLGGTLRDLAGRRGALGRAANAALDGELSESELALVEDTVTAMERALRRWRAPD